MSTTTTPTEKQTTGEVIRTLTGYEERAVASRFGAPFDDLAPRDVTRALLFVTIRRQGEDDQAAFEKAFGMTMTQLGEVFADEPETPAEGVLDLDSQFGPQDAEGKGA